MKNIKMIGSLCLLMLFASGCKKQDIDPSAQRANDGSSVVTESPASVDSASKPSIDDKNYAPVANVDSSSNDTQQNPEPDQGSSNAPQEIDQEQTNEELSQRLFIVESVDEAKALISSGADIHVKDKDGETPLFSIEIDNEDMDLALAKFFIEAGVDIRAKNNEGKTALSSLARLNRVDLIKELIRRGADATVIANDGTTVLFDATDELSDCNPKIIQLLIDAGTDVNAKNNKGKTYIEVAESDCLAELTAAGIVKSGSKMSKTEIESILEDMDVKLSEVNKPDEDGMTPIFFPSNAREVEALIAAGANVNHIAKDKDSPLIFNVSINKDPSIIKALINAGADVNHVDAMGCTALFWVNQASVAQMLIDAGIDLYHLDDSGYNALEILKLHVKSSSKDAEKLSAVIAVIEAAMK